MPNRRVKTALNEGQGFNQLYAEEQLIHGTSIDDIDMEQFKFFIQRKYKKPIDDFQIDIAQMLENLNLSQKGVLTLTGLLLFSGKRHLFRPQFSIQCISADGSIINYGFLDNEGAFEGTLPEVFQRAMDFLGRNMKKIPEGPGFNSPTKWEIPHEVFEEFIVNALVHRDYFISSTVKIFTYSDRVEIISPGRLPNSLTVENIKNGVSIARNPILLSAAQYVLPYRGPGTGIIRSFALYPNIAMENKIAENSFVVTILRNTEVFTSRGL